MSWSIQVVGRPDKINDKLERYSESLSGQSKAEFDEAKLHLSALLLQNVGENMLMQFKASGHAVFADGKKTYGVVTVAIEQLYGELAL